MPEQEIAETDSSSGFTAPEAPYSQASGKAACVPLLATEMLFGLTLVLGSRLCERAARIRRALILKGLSESYRDP